MTTPYFLFNKRKFEKNLNEFQLLKNAGIQVCYAVKANNDKRILDAIVENGMGFDVASVPEITKVLALGADPSKIVYAAPAKKIVEIRFAMKHGIKVLMADTIYGVRKIAKVYGKQQPYSVILRMEGHGARAVFDLSDKFGLTLTEAENIIREASDKGYRIHGFTFHVGSQNADIDAWHNALHKLFPLIKLFEKYNLDLKYIDLGGGIPGKYSSDTLPMSIYVNAVKHLAQFIMKEVPGVQVIVEPGRAIAVEAYDLFASVVDIKDYKKVPVIIIDTSVFMGLIEAAYALNYPIKLKRKSKSPVKEYVVGGITCDGCDIIYKSAMLPSDIKIGDRVKISHAGAYTASWENVHLFSWPKIV